MIGSREAFAAQGGFLCFAELRPGAVLRDSDVLHEAFPKAAGQGFDGGILDGFAGGVLPQLLERGLQVGFRAIAEPVDCEGEVVIGGLNLAGTPGGGAQHRRAAESAVRDQERARLRLIRREGGDARRWHGEARESMETGVVYVEGKKGGRQWFNVMPEGAERVGEGRVFQGTGSDAKGLDFNDVTIG